MEPFNITKIKAGIRQSAQDFLAREVPLTVMLGDKEVVTLLCTPQHIADLVRGFLFSSGLIRRGEDIKKIVVDNEQWIAYVDLVVDTKMEDLVFKRMYTSGCGRGTFFYNPLDAVYRTKLVSDYRIKRTSLNGLMADFQRMSYLYSKTGGVHSAAVAGDRKILVFREDIGRHNAIDKVIGSMIIENLPFEDKVIITTGRISSEIIFKLQKCMSPLIMSKSAPTNQAVKLARQMAIAVVGFVRGERMNIYSEDNRVIID